MKDDAKKDTDTRHLSWDDWDELKSPRPHTNQFDAVVDRAVSRRGFLGGALAFGSGAAVMGTGLLSSTTAARASEATFNFTPVPIATDFDIHLPDGYAWKPLVRWGDPLFADAASAYSPVGGVDVSMADRVFGENTDGMELFDVDGREVLVINSEYANPDINLPELSQGMPQSADEVTLLKRIQGVTVMEIARGDDGYAPVIDSPLNRRIHHDTPMAMDGPAAGSPMLVTEGDPTGMAPLGTMNNCGSGKTLWGTYLTCEENFNGYFGVADAEVEFSASGPFARYGIGREGRYAYETFDARFDVTINPNEPNRHGWVTEIDPTAPDSVPVKHTALGRFKHENAEMVQAADGRVVVYMGDDERGEFLYRYVSDDVFIEGGDTSTLLTNGTLYVARFDDDLTGRWIALTPDTTGMAQDEIAVFTRMAASAVGATTMDRPEWVAANPLRTEAYVALTNNKNRGVQPNAGGDPTPVNGPNPREVNNYGQIVRWTPAGEDHGADTFTWDLYVMAGNPHVGQGDYVGSPNVTEGNMFNSPDGMAFDTQGKLWIQTDGDDSNDGPFTGMGNNQMLVGDTVTGEIARFMTAPNGAEVTGLCWSADRTVMFVGIQHPGGAWPDGAGKPRSSVISVWREDGAQIG